MSNHFFVISLINTKSKNCLSTFPLSNDIQTKLFSLASSPTTHIESVKLRKMSKNQQNCQPTAVQMPFSADNFEQKTNEAAQE